MFIYKVESYKVSGVLFFIKDLSKNDKNRFIKLSKYDIVEDINGSLLMLDRNLKNFRFYNIKSNIKSFYFWINGNLYNNPILYKNFIFSFNDFLVNFKTNPLIKINSNRVSLRILVKVNFEFLILIFN